MKKLYFIITGLLLTINLLAQAPQKMSYQAVIRNASNALLVNQSVGMRISILQGSVTGTSVYTETHNTTTNANGLVSIEIGGGTVISGNFSNITWANGPYFVKTETDPSGGSNYTITGTNQLLSVPYALHAKTAESISGGLNETDPLFNSSIAKSINANDTTRWNNKLNNYTETDPAFNNSLAKNITPNDTTRWNNKLNSYTETDPTFNNSIAKNITANDTARWNNKLNGYTETDPAFNNSLAKNITPNDTARWNNKLNNYNETDPTFNNSLAKNITANDTTRWNNKLDSVIEIDPIFKRSIAYNITVNDTINWKLDNDSTNELQTISLLSDTMSISRGNKVSLSSYKQKLSVSATGDTLFLSSSNWVIIPGISSANSGNIVPGYVPQNGLVAWYPFSGNTNDLSGNSRNGINYGASMALDRFSKVNSAYSFNGVSNFVLVPDTTLPSGNTPRTFSFWIKTNDSSAQSVINHGGQYPNVNFTNNIHYDFSINENIGYGAASGSCSQYNKGASFFTGSHGATFTSPVSNGTWNHIVYVMGASANYSYANIRVYFNGQLISQGQTTWCGHNWGGWTYNTGSGPLIIGRPNGNVRTNFFKGLIDDIGIWNRALTISEIQALYNSQ